jgi:dihydrofolate synthase/folylpolyglutamate synthase
VQDLSRSVESRLEALYGKRPQVIKPGLARVEAALLHLEPDLLTVPTVLIGGTNGKGTTSGYLWELLVRAGLKVGIYSSPHLWRFAERIQVSGIAIDEEYLVAELAKLEADLPPDIFEPLSFFELTTLLAFRVFYGSKVDLMVLEVGMGGRFDATNVADPLISIITSIALDHQQFLGNSTAAIAGEKSGIMRPGRPVLWGGIQAGDVASHHKITEAARELGSPLWTEGESFGVRDQDLFMALPSLAPLSSVRLPQDLAHSAPYLKSNFAKAAAAYCYLESVGLVRRDLGQILFDWDTHPYRRAPSCFGRFQRIKGAPSGLTERSLILDVGHNPAGAAALVQGLRASGLLDQGPIPGLVSILEDKDVMGILDILRPILSPLFLFASSSDRAFTRDMLPSHHADLPFFADVTSAWKALDRTVTEGPWVITGSVYATGEVFRVLGIDPLKDTL